MAGDHVEEDRDEGGRKQHEGGVRDVVEDPLLLRGRELVLVLFAHSLYSCSEEWEDTECALPC